MRDMQKVLGALASPVRREIMSLIWDREVPAGEIAAAFSLTKPTISQHLAVLREAGLVSTTAAGTSRRYRARKEVLRGLHAALGDSSKWDSADDTPERALSDAVTKPVVVAHTDVEPDQASTFVAFTDPGVFSRWLGVPVALDNDRFACTLEWGTQVRGSYEAVCPPELIAIRWDFEDGNIPVPGGELTGYIRIRARERGAHVEVHQLVDTLTQAEFMEAAWTLVLGRLKAGVVDALDPRSAVASRVPRHKRRTSA
jgi:DNA-binding transcriptional ArsR family regulator/uncharacterized protein YndB with AHSA1/START domain